ncbi:MAG: hypothetical protein RBS22_13615, partial [Spongiibacteraceae bacterium]|nr:hypothetical protein [Spongiibacteraceae bacterium]
KALFLDTNITDAFLRVSGQPMAALPAEKPCPAAGVKHAKTDDSKADKQPQPSKALKKQKPKSESKADPASAAPITTPVAEAPAGVGEPEVTAAAPEPAEAAPVEPPKPRRRLSAVKPLGVPKSPLADLPEFAPDRLPPVPEVVDGAGAPVVAGAADFLDPEIIDMSPPAAAPAADDTAPPKPHAGADRTHAAISEFVAAVRASEMPGIQKVNDGLALPLFEAANWIAERQGKSVSWANRTLASWDKSEITIRELSGSRMAVVLE